MKKQLIDLYLSWVNEYLTIESIAFDYGINTEDAETLIGMGRKYHHDSFCEVDNDLDYQRIWGIE